METFGELRGREPERNWMRMYCLHSFLVVVYPIGLCFDSGLISCINRILGCIAHCLEQRTKHHYYKFTDISSSVFLFTLKEVSVRILRLDEGARFGYHGISLCCFKCKALRLTLLYSLILAILETPLLQIIAPLLYPDIPERVRALLATCLLKTNM